MSGSYYIIQSDEATGSEFGVELYSGGRLEFFVMYEGRGLHIYLDPDEAGHLANVIYAHSSDFEAKP